LHAPCVAARVGRPHQRRKVVGDAAAGVRGRRALPARATTETAGSEVPAAGGGGCGVSTGIPCLFFLRLFW
jgi:hypothetical protein